MEDPTGSQGDREDAPSPAPGEQLVSTVDSETGTNILPPRPGPGRTGRDEAAVSAAEQFPGVDPGLVNASVEATSTTPEYRVPTRRENFTALWRIWLRVRLPLVVTALLLLLISLPRTLSSVVQVITAEPLGGTVALVLWLAYALPLIWLIDRVDFFEREPFALIATALLWGGVIATSMAVTANQALFSLLTSRFGEEFTLRWGPAIAAPLTEELLKTLGIIAVILIARRSIRSPIDGFVVGAMVGLGFQVVENFVYTGNLLLSSSAGAPLQTVFNVFVVRGIGSGLWSHAVYSGIAGMGVAYLLVRTDRSRGRRILAAAVLFALAWLLHLIWNLPVIWEGLSRVAVAAKALAILGLLALVLSRNRGRESYIYTEYLEAVHDPAVVTLAEIEDLRTYRTREAAARLAAKTGGGRAGEAVRRLQRRQADLSVAMALGDLEEVARARRGIATARAQLTTAALLPDEVGHRWGVASIWMSILGVLLPVIAPLVAMVLAAIGTRQAQRERAELAASVRAAWVLSAISMLVGIVLVYLVLLD